MLDMAIFPLDSEFAFTAGKFKRQSTGMNHVHEKCNVFRRRGFHLNSPGLFHLV